MADFSAFPGEAMSLYVPLRKGTQDGRHFVVPAGEYNPSNRAPNLTPEGRPATPSRTCIAGQCILRLHAPARLRLAGAEPAARTHKPGNTTAA